MLSLSVWLDLPAFAPLITLIEKPLGLVDAFTLLFAFGFLPSFLFAF